MLPWLSLRQDVTVDFREPQVFRGTSLDWPGRLAHPPSTWHPVAGLCPFSLPRGDPVALRLPI